MTQATRPPALSKTLPSASSVRLASYTLMLLLCLGSLIYGLLPGLLAVCLGYLFAAALAGQQRAKALRLRPSLAAGVVIFLPLLALALLLANAKGMVFGAVSQYQALLHHLAGTVLEIRQKLPADLASHLPDELVAVQVWLAAYLKSKAQALAGFGSTGLRGGLLVYVGLVVGALMVGTPLAPNALPLRASIRQRAGFFIQSFRQIVIAQFWIASFNTLFTAIFLLLALPYFGVQMPFVGSLLALTFFAGLIPIVGNLICNSVLALAGVSISPAVGLACLVFLIAIHKTEYVINAKVLGRQTNTATWELLAVMFIGEAVFGMPGLVAAPLYYAYVKKELQTARLV